MFKSRYPASLGSKLTDQIWPRTGFRRAFAYRMHRMARFQGSEHRISIGFAAGAFASFTPFMGLHFLIAAVIALAIRGSVVASAVGTVVGNPFTFPWIWISAYKLGSLVLGAGAASQVGPGPLSSITLSSVSGVPLWQVIAPVLLPMTVGGVMLGLVFSTACYAVMITLLRRIRAGGLRRVRRVTASQRMR